MARRSFPLAFIATVSLLMGACGNSSSQAPGGSQGAGNASSGAGPSAESSAGSSPAGSAEGSASAA